MAKLKVRVSVEHTEVIDTDDYASAWEEKCIQDGEVEEGEEIPLITDEFVLEAFQQKLDDGEIDLSVLFESDPIHTELLP